MIPEMVIGVSDYNIEYDPPVQFFQIPLYDTSMSAYKIRNISVAEAG